MRYRRRSRRRQSQNRKPKQKHQPARAKQRHQYVDVLRYFFIHLIFTGSQRAEEQQQTESAEVDGIEFKVTGGESWLELGLKAKKRVTVRKFKGMHDLGQC
jgi:hypothetical protein